MKIKTTFTLLAAFLIVGANVDGDVVYTTAGQKLEGITRPDPNTEGNILVITHAAQLSLSPRQIERIEEEPEYKGRLKIGWNYFNSGQYEQALKQFNMARESNPDDPEVQSALEQTRSVLDKEKTAAEREIELQIQRNIEQIKSMIQERNFENAERLFEQTMAMQPNEIQKPELKSLQVQLYYKWALNHLNHVNQPAAIEKLEKVRKLDPGYKPAREQLIRLYQQDDSRQEDVLNYWQEALQQNPQDMEMRLKVANAYYDMGEYAKAIPHYRKVYESDSSLEGAEVEDRLAESYVSVTQQAARNFDFQKAREYYSEYLEVFPNADRSPLNQYEYAVRVKQINQNDPQQLVELASWAREKGMHKYAQDLYRHAERLSEENEEAVEGLRYYADELLSEAMQALNMENYIVAQQLSTDVIENFYMLPERMQKAQELLEKSRLALREKRESRRDQAENYVVQGDQYFSRGESFMTQLRNREFESERGASRAFLINPRHEASKNFGRAIEMYQAALQIDPSLNQTYDLSRKIQDAYTYISRLEGPPLPFRRRTERDLGPIDRSRSQRNVQ